MGENVKNLQNHVVGRHFHNKTKPQEIFHCEQYRSRDKSVKNESGAKFYKNLLKQNWSWMSQNFSNLLTVQKKSSIVLQCL